MQPSLSHEKKQNVGALALATTLQPIMTFPSVCQGLQVYYKLIASVTPGHVVRFSLEGMIGVTVPGYTRVITCLLSNCT